MPDIISLLVVFVIIIYILIYLLVGLRITKPGIVCRVFFPADFFTLFYLLFFLIPFALFFPLRNELVYRYSDTGYEPVNWLIAILYSMVFVAIFYILNRKLISRELFVYRLLNLNFIKEKSKLFYLLVFVLGTISVVYSLFKFGGQNYVEYMTNRTVLKAGMGYVLMPSIWLSVGIALLFCREVIFGKKRLINIILILFTFIFYTLVQLYLGSKSKGLVIIVWFLLTYLLINSPKISLLTSAVRVLIVGMSVGVLGLTFGDYRESMTKQVDVTSVESRAQFSMAFSKFNAFGAIENTIWLVENHQLDNYRLGSTFGVIILGAIPRKFWNDKPVGGGPTLRNLIHPGSYDLKSGNQLSSYSPGVIAESYINFGFLGVLFTAPLLAFVFYILTKLFFYIRTDFELITWVVSLYALGYMMTGEVFGTFARLFMFLIPIILIRTIKYLPLPRFRI